MANVTLKKIKKADMRFKKRVSKMDKKFKKTISSHRLV